MDIDDVVVCQRDDVFRDLGVSWNKALCRQLLNPLQSIQIPCHVVDGADQVFVSVARLERQSVKYTTLSGVW